MKTATKVWLIVAVALVFAGLIIILGVMTVLKWDWSRFSTDKFESNSSEITEEYKNISITTNTAHIVFIPSENEKTVVTCYERDNEKHTVTVKDNTLTVELVDTRKWYEHIGITMGTPKITVYLPMNEYAALTVNGSTGDVSLPQAFKFESIDISISTGDANCYSSAAGAINIKTRTGHINVCDLSAGTLELCVTTGNVTASGVSCEGKVNVSVSTGKSYLSDVRCKELISNGDTGDISMMNVIATDKFSVERSTGDVKLEGCDAAEIVITTDTGDVWGSLLSDKVFITHTDTGKVDTPKTTVGGRCEITTDTGDIKIQIKEKTA